ncbi:phosphomannomutase/phosphoglucomutase [Patescibacteria group bacterium]|nr:phosphomannomutase/phosphoglucomutase [Patescibacteria group bacterium]
MANLNKYMFREYDIRGRESESELNEISMELIGKGFGTWLIKRGIKNVVVGYDNRVTSEAFSKAVIKGLLSCGHEVTEIGTVITPMLYWAQHHLQIQGGVMVTASHNPVGWNGLKLADDYSSTLLGENLKEVYEIIEKEQFVTSQGVMRERQDVSSPYYQDLLSKVKIQRKLKVVVNTGNGTAGFFAPELLRQAGCEVIEHLTKPDPSYPNYTPNPAQEEMMEDTGKKVVEVKADLGFAFDADGDRLGLTDEEGSNIWPDRYLILLSRSVLENNPGAKIVFDVKVSQALPEDIASHGGIPVMWKTGHSYIKQKAREIGAPLAGEMSGHIFFFNGYYGFDDALFAALKLLEYISSQKESVSELIKSTPYYISTPSLHAPCPDEKKYKVVENLTKEFKKEGYEVIDINGARVIFSQKGWGLVRASSNLPALVLRFEAKTKDQLQEIERVFRTKLKQYPFVGEEWETA